MRLALCFPATDPAPAVVWNTFRSSQSPLLILGLRMQGLLARPNLEATPTGPSWPRASPVGAEPMPPFTQCAVCVFSSQSDQAHLLPA